MSGPFLIEHGTGHLYQTTITLTDADLRALVASPPVLIPDPGAGKTILTESWYVNPVGPGTYSDGNFQPIYDGFTSDGIWADPISLEFDWAGSGSPWQVPLDTERLSVHAHAAIVLHNSDTEATVGDSGNRLVITIAYRIVPSGD